MFASAKLILLRVTRRHVCSCSCGVRSSWCSVCFLCCRRCSIVMQKLHRAIPRMEIRVGWGSALTGSSISSFSKKIVTAVNGLIAYTYFWYVAYRLRSAPNEKCRVHLPSRRWCGPLWSLPLRRSANSVRPQPSVSQSSCRCTWFRIAAASLLNSADCRAKRLKGMNNFGPLFCCMITSKKCRVFSPSGAKNRRTQPTGGSKMRLCAIFQGPLAGKSATFDVRQWHFLR